ncbi:MAG: patatin-like phospholipase family protein [Deltaproteobacteria bacterium]|nr:patatin-like phospholipase family protein [Deltaproteobacteria bacterium]
MWKLQQGITWFLIGLIFSFPAVSDENITDVSSAADTSDSGAPLSPSSENSHLVDADTDTHSDEHSEFEADTSTVDTDTSRSDRGAQPPLPTGDAAASRQPTPLSITIRGGSSLGAYEAGYLYILTEAIKRNPEYFSPNVLSGASAGSINAVLSVVSLGSHWEDDPLSSIYYRIWRKLNFRELLDVGSDLTPPGALSSRQLMWRISDELRTEWLRGFRTDFSVLMGISTTRLIPETIVTKGGVEIPNQQAKFVFRVEGKGEGKPPMMSNHQWVKPGLEQLLLPFGRDAKTDFNVMMQVVFASSGIPIAFPPQPIDYCVAEIRDDSELSCPDEETYTDSFVDGGVVDNSPIHLTYQVHKSLLEAAASQQPVGDDATDATGKSAEREVILLYLDPEHLRYPVNSPPTSVGIWGDVGGHRTYDHGVNLFGTLPGFVKGFVSSSRSSEIYSLLNNDPDVNIQRTENSFAPISAQVSGQFGFMEREILKYDFYLGMHDAENYLRKNVLAYLQRTVNPAIERTDIRLPQDTYTAATQPGWQPYRCMRAMFDGEGDPRMQCSFTFNETDASEPPDVENFKILMQVSINRVYSHCSLLDSTEKIAEELKVENGMCQRAYSAGVHGTPPLVPGVRPLEDDSWYRCIARRRAIGPKEKARAQFACHHHRRNETEYQYVTRLMGEYGYWFRDLGLTRDNAEEIRAVVQNELFDVVDAFAKKYETISVENADVEEEEHDKVYAIGEVSAGDRALILTLGKPAITFLNYSPPKSILSLMIGRESSVSWSVSKSGWLRLTWNLIQVGGVDTLINRLKVLNFIHAAGLEWQPPWFSTAVVQATMIGRVGYQLSSRGNFTDGSCGHRMDESASRCSLPLFQTLMSVAFLSRIRLELGINWFLPWRKLGLPNRKLNTVLTAAVGFQFLN